ncbi:MAG: PspC domain-containing protein [Methanocalculus sp. MSAO_Arc1]|uniref:PspC domain-containing protein n=1 Tax=Methanocalculus TaxID=71151 RepID=UPI000FF02C79|nr:MULTISPECIES: PspC domain-containing protein [unclassified Methanocalculus]MCP1662501.1 phage shock protein C [Methanocalculus sp. AMF5]RQD80841.1 MAG: PspC domain-containing protein [Methanocalculus sp. MSAO_Arc1]
MEEAPRLMRSRSTRLIAGVCGGIAEHYGWDPSLVRIAWIVLSLVPAFPGIIIYILAWIIIPEGEEENKAIDDSYQGV